MNRDDLLHWYVKTFSDDSDAVGDIFLNKGYEAGAQDGNSVRYNDIFDALASFQINDFPQRKMSAEELRRFARAYEKGCADQPNDSTNKLTGLWATIITRIDALLLKRGAIVTTRRHSEYAAAIESSARHGVKLIVTENDDLLILMAALKEVERHLLGRCGDK